MVLHQALIKNFNEYLAGGEVLATVHLKDNEIITPGEHVLVLRDTVASTTDIPTPRDKQTSVIGVEGTITEIQINETVMTGHRAQIVKVVKL